MNPIKVIVIEDHEKIRNLIVNTVMRTASFQVVAEAGDGVEGLEKIKTIPSDLIILDLGLPRKTGLKVLKEAKKYTTSKFLVVTAHSESVIIKEALDAGADGVYSKELGREVLEKALLEIMGGMKSIYLPAHAENI